MGVLDIDYYTDVDDEKEAIKVPANRIPEEEYVRFTDRLVEVSTKYAERNYMLFKLGIATGYRTQDLVDLTIRDIKQALNLGSFVIQEKKQYKRWLKYMKDMKKELENPILNKKPRSPRRCPDKRPAKIEKNLERLLREYVKNKKNSEYAFTSNKGSRYIEAKSFSKILSEVGKSLELKNISGHSMRKTFAYRIWEEEENLEKVRLALGHKSIETTKRYLGIEEEVRNNAAKIADSKL